LIMQRIEQAQEKSEFWSHCCFRDLGLMKARFTRHRYELHTHPTYVIAVITGGCERIRIGNHTVVASAGTVAVVDPEECHDGEPGAEGGWTYRTFYPSVPLMTTVAQELGQNQPPLFFPALIEDTDLVRLLILAHVNSTSRDAIGAEASMLVALRHLILRYRVSEARPERVEDSGARHRLSVYQQIVESDLTGPLNLQRLADAAGVTRFQVIRDFKKEAGLTPTGYIRNRKLRCASLLIEQGMNLADAAVAAGFADQSHLSRTFRAIRGITPGMFKKGVIASAHLSVL
jgi:AraC-like DNA-binding protein